MSSQPLEPSPAEHISKEVTDVTLEQGTNSENPPPTEKIYSQNSIRGGSFPGGPLVAGYIIARNFKAFNESKKAWVTWIVTIGASAVIFSVAVLLSDTNWRGLPIAYTAIVYALIRHYQGLKVDAHIKAGGPTHQSFTESPIVREYQSLKHEIYFQRSNVSVEEVDKLAAGLRKAGFFDEVSRKEVYVRKVKDTYEVSIPCSSEITIDPNLYKEFIPLRNDMQQLFPRNKIILNLVMESLDNVVKRIE